MPIFEFQCDQCSQVVEHYLPLATSPNPDCCGNPMKRLVSRFAVVFTGVMSGPKYNDPKLDNYHRDGHWAWRVRSSKSGNPEPVYLNSWQEQAQFCREESLINPKDCPNMDGDSEGKLKSNAGVGMPGAWT